MSGNETRAEASAKLREAADYLRDCAAGRISLAAWLDETAFRIDHRHTAPAEWLPAVAAARALLREGVR